MKKILLITLTLISIIIFSACANQDTMPLDYPEGDTVTVENPYMTITLPEGWNEKAQYQVNDECISIYCKSIYDKYESMGHICSFMIFKDDSYKQLPDYKVLNQTKDYTCIMTRPTDVQFDEDTASEYHEMEKQIDWIVSYIHMRK